ncbi:MAG: DUF5689 domain-containing protein, partial [Saprospiraceae bacterium]
MNTINKFLFLLILISGLFITSCVDNDFDEPENTFNIDSSNIINLSDVLDMLNPNTPTLLDDNKLGGEAKYIKATITADDASGNFYRTITFADKTGALSVLADRNELNAEFPTGNLIYIKLNNLTIASDANLPRLGYGVESGRLQRIPDILVNDFLIPGGSGSDSVIPPTEVTISEYKSNPSLYYNKLIMLTGVEFTLDYVGSTFADPDNSEGPRTINTDIQDCDDNSVIVRNSGYADFAGKTIPAGNGTLVAIAGVFGDVLQLTIRDLNDINMTGDRCDGSGGQADNEITIQSIQDRFYDLGADNVQEGFIKGIVISDRNTGQVNSQNVFLQNGEDGILIRFSADHNYNLGDELQITVTDRELSEFKTLLQINNVPSFNVILLGNTDLPTPKELKVSDILADNNTYESTRVLIKGVTLNGGTFSGNVAIDDGSGSINIFTFNTTSYADSPVPSGLVDVTAIVSEYEGTPQLVINGVNDIKGGTTDPNGNDGESVNQDFENLTDFDNIDFKGWMNIATQGDRVWYSRSFDGNGYAECEAYQDNNSNTEAWLVTPSIDTDEKSTFSFESSQAFWQHQGLSVWISEDFDNISDANWVEMTDARIANSNDEQYDFISSGDIALKDYFGGKVKVGFK